MPDLTVYSIIGGELPQTLNLSPLPKSLDDVSRQLPQGVYSTFRTFDGGARVLGLRLHLARLYDPAFERGLAPSVASAELRQMLKTLLEPYKPGEARVRISLSLAESPGQVFVALEPLKLLDETVYQRGVRVVTSHVERVNPRLKSTAFIQKSAQERSSMLKNDIFEALMVHAGHVQEGLTSNFYLVKDRTIITAQQGILLGVTRRYVLRLARAQGCEIEYRAPALGELSECSEAFLTSSSRGVVPVVEINEFPVGQGRPGQVAILLRRVYDDDVLRKAEEI